QSGKRIYCLLSQVRNLDDVPTADALRALPEVHSDARDTETACVRCHTQVTRAGGRCRRSWLVSGVVVGVDSSTQSCKVLVVEVGTGRTVASATAPHPEGTAIDPRAWVEALRRAWDAAGVGSRGDLLGVGVSAQQHGMVAVDPQGRPVHGALLWNDTRSADQAARLIADLGIGSWMEATNVLPVPSITLTKLAWLREHEPQAAARVQREMLPHDWLVMHLTGAFATDRSDASGTGYFD